MVKHTVLCHWHKSNQQIFCRKPKMSRFLISAQFGPISLIQYNIDTFFHLAFDAQILKTILDVIYYWYRYGILFQIVNIRLKLKNFCDTGCERKIVKTPTNSAIWWWKFWRFGGYFSIPFMAGFQCRPQDQSPASILGIWETTTIRSNKWKRPLSSTSPWQSPRSCE